MNLPNKLEICMKGKVRSREKRCPHGHGLLTIDEEVDIYCQACGYRPKTFYLDLFWEGEQLKIGRNVDGRILATYRQAHRLLETIRSEIDAGTFSPSRYIPKRAAEYRGALLIPKWLATKADKAPTTRREYQRYADTYLLPFFGSKDLRDVRSGDFEEFREWLKDRQGSLGRKALSLKTEKNIFTAVRNLCGWLHRREIIARLPELPAIAPPEPIIECISRDDQLKALAMMQRHHRPIFEFLIFHPVRTGEARALRRKHFNLDDMTVHIAEAWSLKEIRSRKSKKDYYLPISAQFDLAVLEGKQTDDFVFLNEPGRPYKAENIRRIWHRACKKAGVPRIKLYNGTRHSTATDTLRRSGSLYKVSKLLGHSSQRMTEKYAKHDVELLRGLTDGAVDVRLTAATGTL